MAQVVIEIRGEALAFAPQAAEWVARFVPSISAEILGSQASLRSDVHSETQLSRIWKSSLLNEKQFANARESRLAAISQLVQ